MDPDAGHRLIIAAALSIPFRHGRQMRHDRVADRTASMNTPTAATTAARFVGKRRDFVKNRHFSRHFSMSPGVAFRKSQAPWPSQDQARSSGNTHDLCHRPYHAPPCDRLSRCPRPRAPTAASPRSAASKNHYRMEKPTCRTRIVWTSQRILLLMLITLIGCSKPPDERLVELSERANARQQAQNETIARQTEKTANCRKASSTPKPRPARNCLRCSSRSSTPKPSHVKTCNVFTSRSSSAMPKAAANSMNCTARHMLRSPPHRPSTASAT